MAIARVILKAALFAGSCLLVGITAVLADQPKVTTSEGHVSPLQAKVTFPDGKTQIYMITGFYPNDQLQYDRYAYFGKNPSGGVVSIWLDTIKTIIPNNDGVLVVLKNGNERQLGWSYPIYNWPPTFSAANDDARTETINVNGIKSIEFLNQPRKDGDGNAMFPNWHYSPFTGEKLAKE